MTKINRREAIQAATAAIVATAIPAPDFPQAEELKPIMATKGQGDDSDFELDWIPFGFVFKDGQFRQFYGDGSAK